MEFIDPSTPTAPQTPVNEPAGADGKADTSSAANDSVNVRTEEAVQKLESEIAKTYNVVESQMSSLWSSASKNAGELQEKYQLEERRKQLAERLNSATTSLADRAKISENLQHVETQLKSLSKNIDVQTISTHANNAIDALDSKLEIVEKEAGKLVSSFASFFSGIVAVNGPVSTQTDDALTQGETLFDRNAAQEHYGTSRYDTELFKLHTTGSFYTAADGAEADLAAFKVDSKTDEIAALLRQYPDTLEKLMNSLVPVSVKYDTFWYRYFRAEAKLKESEQKRKELLSRKKDEKKPAEGAAAAAADEEDDDDEEEFTWDDDEDEEEDAAAKK